MLKQIARFFRSLLPVLQKNHLEKELERVRTELTDNTVPLYESSAELMRGRKFQSDYFQNFEKTFQKHIDTRYRGNFIDITHAILKEIEKPIGMLTSYVQKMEQDDIATKTMSIQEAQLVKMIEALDFLSRYSRMILIYALMEETKAYDRNDMLDLRLKPAQIKWLEDHRMTFIVVLNVFTKKERDLKQAFDEIPDIDFNEETIDAVVSQVGNSKLDPNKLMRTNLKNPIFYLRMPFADWQVTRYEAAKEERRMLEYQIQNLRLKLQDENDPKIEQALEYQLDRLSSLNAKIHKMEEKIHEES